MRRGDPSGTVGVDGREVGVDDDDEDAAVDGLVGRKGESFRLFNQSNEWPKQIRRNHALCHNLYLVLKFYDF